MVEKDNRGRGGEENFRALYFHRLIGFEFDSHLARGGGAGDFLYIYIYIYFLLGFFFAYFIS